MFYLFAQRCWLLCSRFTFVSIDLIFFFWIWMFYEHNNVILSEKAVLDDARIWLPLPDQNPDDWNMIDYLCMKVILRPLVIEMGLIVASWTASGRRYQLFPWPKHLYIRSIVGTCDQRRDEESKINSINENSTAIHIILSGDEMRPWEYKDHGRSKYQCSHFEIDNIMDTRRVPNFVSYTNMYSSLWCFDTWPTSEFSILVQTNIDMMLPKLSWLK